MKVVPLSKVRKEDVLLCGNKGAQLGELAYIGLPVPDGFVVTTEAYTDFMTQTGLGEQIAETLLQVDPTFHPDLSSIAEEIKGWALQVHMGDDIKIEIEDKYLDLGVERVAVRSSPVFAQDPQELFSGRLATTMDVSKENIQENVERAWVSLFSTRGLEYLYKGDLVGKKVLVAVVVQAVVYSNVSGVMYCGKLPTRTAECLVVEAGWGLGETMVSGVVTPDRYVVNIEASEVTESTIGNQMKEYTKAAGTLKLVDVPDFRVHARKMTDGQVLRLASYYKKIVDHYGVPQKIEWALSGDDFYILQTRPLNVLVGG